MAWVAWLASRPRVPYWVVVGLIAASAIVDLAVYHEILRESGVPAPPIEALLPARALNVYLIVVSAIFIREGARRLLRLPGRRESGMTGRPIWQGWLVPVAVAAALSISYLVGVIGAAVEAPAATATIPYLATVVLGLLINLPMTTAFWLGLIGLVAVSRLGRESLPQAFPEDRSLGLLPVGRVVLFVFVALTAAFAPLFVTGLLSLPNFLIAVGLFALAAGAIILALWRLHVAMTTERGKRIAAARVRYARAYRTLERSMGSTRRNSAVDVGPAASTLSAAEALLRGAESIYQWPFDEQMQRVAAIVVTGVVTSIAVRLILFALGL